MSTLNFNAQQYQPQFGGASGLPAGPNGEPVRYKVVISGDEIKPTKDTESGMLSLELTCIEGPYAQSKQILNLNLWNKNPQASEIANKQLSAICHAVQTFVVSDSRELHNKPFIVGIRPQKNDAKYTEVFEVLDINGNEPGNAAAQPQQQAPVQQAPPPAAAPQAAPPAGWTAQQQAPAVEAAPPAAAWSTPAQQQPPAQAWGSQAQGNAAQPGGGAPGGWAQR